ncbi:DUF6456 domain-containing protein [Erythrobacter sanguineus]|jgi:hypothetical protein|uniref:DUF6456 domain-containing protein n=1 Tax=Erythrobacter sanguineus TaxID=198312 RepID=A0A1M7SPS3_9SPHN|nr:DUF6456 domain-containing protein [Erythrobacter sanguineus]MCR9180696.1 DUF6456 domain-containing protein [Erythrobacteraceae bacterium]SHN60426.1 hypothetical protein SAMN02745193_02127 [Erythrobacter sanguineus]
MKRQLVERELSSEGPRRVKAGLNTGLNTGQGAGKGGRPTRTVTVNLAESPLAWLHARGHLDDRLFDAGEALRGDYERAQLSASVTMRWDPVRVKTTGERGLAPGERQIAARQRFDGAIKAAGKGLEDILWRVVCAGEALPEAEKGLGWPARSGKLVLRIALERVAEFYRIR